MRFGERMKERRREGEKERNPEFSQGVLSDEIEPGDRKQEPRKKTKEKSSPVTCRGVLFYANKEKVKSKKLKVHCRGICWR
jgi:hypothetical protein